MKNEAFSYQLRIVLGAAFLAIAGPAASQCIVDLGNFEPFGINDAGEIVGLIPATEGPAFGHAGIWRDGQLAPLLSGDVQSQAQGVNNRGLVVGATADVAGQKQWHGFTWWKGTLTPLLAPNSDTSPTTWRSYPYAANNAGQVAAGSVTN
jgi:uncharacterized membrane protein